MVNNGNVLEVQRSELFDIAVGDVVHETEEFTVREMVFTPAKVRWLWTKTNEYRTLYSDFTRNDIDNFINLIILPNSFWMEVFDKANDEIVGIVYLTGIESITDAIVHVMFFDRHLASKVDLCKSLLRVMFDKFGFHRLSAIVPEIYHATVRLAQKVGFKPEGCKREALLMNGKWVNELAFGILAEEL